MNAAVTARAVLNGPAGPAIRALVAAELCSTEYGDLEQAGEELAGDLDLLRLDVTERRLDNVALELVEALRVIDRCEHDPSPAEQGKAAVAELELEELLALVVRR